MELQQSINNQTEVSITFATHILSKKFQNSNVVFSPLSIHVILSLIAAGSKDQTLDQLLAFLKINTADDLNSLYLHLVPLIFGDDSPVGTKTKTKTKIKNKRQCIHDIRLEPTPGPPTRGPRLAFANGVWVEKTLYLKPCFKQVVDTVYKASCMQVDFQNKAVEVVKEVNLWAKKQTNGHIKQILQADALEKSTMLILVNAIYFKGAWSQKFDRSMTKESDFHLLEGSKVQVPFMTSHKAQLVCEYDDFKVLALPYLQGSNKQKITMYLFLPDAKDGLQSLLEKLGSTSDFLNRHIPREKVQVGQFFIPKFKMSFGFEASGMLKQLGIVSPFNHKDGMTEMVDGQRLYASSIHHKSFVRVNEKGTEAAAVSARGQLMGCRRNYKPKKVDFVADHPFLFVIKEDVTRVVLFMGQVIDPSKRI